jgi:DNA mismatch repair protein MutS
MARHLKLTEIYFQLFDYYSRRYPKAAILLQCGNFFELYSRLDDSGSNVHVLAKLANMENNPKGDTGCKMAGFPLASYEKYSQIFIRNGYTIVRIEQVSDDYMELEGHFTIPNADGKRRAVTEIVSPSINFESIRDNNNIIAMYIEKYTKDLVAFEMAIHDTLCSDNIFTIEFDAFSNDTNLSIDNAIEFVLRNNPVDFILVTKNGQNVNDIVKKLSIPCQITQLDIQQVHNRPEDCIPVNALKDYLEDKLLETDNLVICPYEFKNKLDLSSTAIFQLNLMLLYNLINKCQTAMGSRLLYNRLTSPMTDPVKIQEIYDKTIRMNNAEHVKNSLKDQVDYEKIWRRIALGKSTFFNFKTFYNSLKNLTGKSISIEETFVDDIESSLNMENERIFIVGIHDDIDVLYNSKVEVEAVIKKFQSDIQKIVVRLENLKYCKDDLGILVSHTRGRQLKNVYPNWKYNDSGKETIVSTPELLNALRLKSQVLIEIKRLENERFLMYQQDFFERNKVNFNIFCREIAELDFLQNSYFMQKKYRLNFAVLSNEHILDIMGLRHLVIENINEDVEYIPNDLELDDKCNGYIIYGMNSTGKSSFLKASGLAVILAQAGLAVPCVSMKFKPIKRIITRICGNDSIEKSQSSFIVEANEIKSILNRGNSDTLILVDEACKGTESDSACKINVNLIKWMVQKNSFFLSTTHLHQISDHLGNIEKVKVLHMKVILEGDTIDFKRILEPGSGPVSYGILIAQHLGFPKEFINDCMEMDNESFTRKSRYNSKMIVDHCDRCNYQPKKDTDLKVDSHHIIGQCNMDKEGFIKDTHVLMNRKSNLVNLCKKCHQNVHKKKFEIKVIQTLKGQKCEFIDIV